MNGIVDRIEDGIVTLEIDGDYFNFDLEKFPKEIREGDLISYKNEEFIILVDETIAKTKEIKSLFNSLLEKND